LTKDTENSETLGKDAPLTGEPDPRIVAFVRLLARRAAEEDYARHLKRHGKARKDNQKKQKDQS
jgi:hypothetical protein